MDNHLSMYVVRNYEGKFFRAKGLNGYGETWVFDLREAKFYIKISQARSRVTFFANNYPDLKPPEILEAEVRITNVVGGESERLDKALKKIARDKENQIRWSNESYVREVENNFKKAKAELEKLRKK